MKRQPKNWEKGFETTHLMKDWHLENMKNFQNLTVKKKKNATRK